MFVLMRVDDFHIAQSLATLPSGQVICDAVSVGCGVWVSVIDSPILHLLHIPSGEVLTCVDCTLAVMSILQGQCTMHDASIHTHIGYYTLGLHVYVLSVIHTTPYILLPAFIVYHSSGLLSIHFVSVFLLVCFVCVLGEHLERPCAY